MTALLDAARGDIDVSASKEVLQQGVLHAFAAAAGCTLSPPFPDVTGVDWTVTLPSMSHTSVIDAQIDVQLKCTETVAPASSGEFSFTLKNEHFEKLARTNISHPRLLLVMICPPDTENWVRSRAHWTLVRHSMYWVNLYGKTPTGMEKSNVRVPYKQRLDDRELCRILHAVGNGVKPWVF
ncbi:hypothetical protein RHOER0001_4354 [Rhodococcus erythropolis SK121]|nr:hypothetical protein RHOER0001_4354 [Rhodococcus erythropolis SK121]